MVKIKIAVNLAALSICLLTVKIAFGQEQNIYFMKNDGRYTSSRDSADYIRVISSPDSGTVLYNVKDYYINGKVKLVGQSPQIMYNRFEGQVVSFFPSGKRKEMATYERGIPVGDIYDYYPNGKLYAIKQFLPPVNADYNQFLEDNYAIKTCNDSTGKANVTDGNGHDVVFNDDFKTIREEGDVVNTLRNGLWKGMVFFIDADKDTKDTLTISEHYHNGNLIDGTSTDKLGKTYTYTKRLVNPQYPGGEVALGHFLRQHVSYPTEAKANHIVGRVYIKFIVEESGKLTDIKVLREPGGGTAEESIRVLKLSPPWIPSTEFGKPVRISFTMPINFSLGSSN